MIYDAIYSLKYIQSIVTISYRDDDKLLNAHFY